MIRRSHFRQVQRDKTDEHSQAEPMEQTNGNEHADGHRARDESGADQRCNGRDLKGSFPPDRVGEPALCEGADGQTEVEESIDCAEDTVGPAELDFSSRDTAAGERRGSRGGDLLRSVIAGCCLIVSAHSSPFYLSACPAERTERPGGEGCMAG